MSDLMTQMIQVLLRYGNHRSDCRLMTALHNLPNLNHCTCGWDEVKRIATEKESVIKTKE